MRSIAVLVLAVTFSVIVEAKEPSDASAIRCNFALGSHSEKIVGSHEVADMYNRWLQKPAYAVSVVDARVETLKNISSQKDKPEYVWTMEEPNSLNKIHPVTETHHGARERKFPEEANDPLKESVFGFNLGKIKFRYRTFNNDTNSKNEYSIDFSEATSEDLVTFINSEAAREQELFLAKNAQISRVEPTYDYGKTTSSDLTELTQYPNEQSEAFSHLIADILARREQQVLYKGLYLQGYDAELAYNSFTTALSQNPDLAQTKIQVTPSGQNQTITTFGHIILTQTITNGTLDHSIDLRDVTDPKELMSFVTILKNNSDLNNSRAIRVYSTILGYGLPVVVTRHDPTSIYSAQNALDNRTKQNAVAQSNLDSRLIALKETQTKSATLQIVNARKVTKTNELLQAEKARDESLRLKHQAEVVANRQGVIEAARKRKEEEQIKIQNRIDDARLASFHVAHRPYR